MDRNSSHIGLGGSDWTIGLWANAQDGADRTALGFWTNLRHTQSCKVHGSRATCRANSVELAELAPQLEAKCREKPKERASGAHLGMFWRGGWHRSLRRPNAVALPKIRPHVYSHRLEKRP